MPKWTYNIEIGDLHRLYERDAIDLAELGRRVASRIRECPAFRHPVHGIGLEDIAERFGDLDYEDANRDDYDNILADLYDWGDMGLTDEPLGPKMCWINTLESLMK